MSRALPPIELEHTVYGLRLDARGGGESLCRPARGSAQRRLEPQVVQHTQDALDYGGLARAGTAGDDLHAVLDGGAHRLGLRGMQFYPRLPLEARDFALHIHAEIRGFGGEPYKALGYPDFGVVALPREQRDALAGVVSDQFAEQHHVLDVILDPAGGFLQIQL